MKVPFVILLVFVFLFVSACGRSSATEDRNTTLAEEGAVVQSTAAPFPTSSIASPASEPVQSEPASGTVANDGEPNDASVASSRGSGDVTSSEVYLPERLLIPSIDLDTSVVELGWSQNQADDGRIFSQWDVADNAAGWHLNSARLGEGGNVVLSGHNNIYGAIFRELDQLKRGDEALLSANGKTYRYYIDKVLIVPEKYATAEQRESNADWIGHFDDDRLTLVSCWPRDDNSHRIVVVAFAEDSSAMLDDESSSN